MGHGKGMGDILKATQPYGSVPSSTHTDITSHGKEVFSPKSSGMDLKGPDTEETKYRKDVSLKQRAKDYTNPYQ